MSLSKVIELARADLGYTENPPGSNITKYGEAYGMNGVPWCVEALWYWFNQAGERMAFFGGGKTASCSTLLRWYLEQGLTVPVSEVRTGDIVLLNFNGKGTADHCGLVVDRDIEWANTASDNIDDWFRVCRINVVEGNTTPGEEGSQDNGGCVASKWRYPYQIVAVCRPQYRPETETGDPSSAPSGHLPPGEGKDDITGHWAEDNIRWCMDKGLMKGYPDGGFRPDKPVTRAELAVILDRLNKEEDGK